MANLIFEIGKTYNFKTYAGSQLGLYHSLLTVSSVMNMEEAISKYRDVISLHKSLLPSLPEGTTKDPSLLTYILFEDRLNNNKKLFALEWINLSTVEETEGLDLQVNIFNISTSDVMLITSALRNLGFNNFEIKNIV